MKLIASPFFLPYTNKFASNVFFVLLLFIYKRRKILLQSFMCFRKKPNGHVYVWGKKRKIRGEIMYIKGRYISIKGVVCCFYFIASYIYTEHSSEGILFTFNNLDAVKLFRNFHFVFVCLHETTL